MDILLHYFPNLPEEQVEQFQALGPLYREWNAKINVISRQDIDNLYERHLLHALAIPKVLHFVTGAEILDLGTGGGFPGIPLAIVFPEVQFMLIDGTRKKIKVVQEIVDALELKNVTAQQVRAEELKSKRFDFVVTRAVAKLEQLIPWSNPLLKNKHQHAVPNGLLALKGGNIKAELAELPAHEYVEVFPLSDFFEESYYEEKYLIYVQGA